MHDDDAGAMLDRVESYYTGRLREHGPTARGVDWPSETSQRLRFEQFDRLFAHAPDPVSVNDLGCGYGSLLEHLDVRVPGADYLGIDLSAPMLAAAAARHGARPGTRFLEGGAPDRSADFTVASGIFNVRLGADPQAWDAYVLRTLDLMDATSRLGFAFNCLTRYSDADRMRPDLHYADPGALFDHCKRRYARNVALLHDYGLYEFTMIVRKGG